MKKLLLLLCVTPVISAMEESTFTVLSKSTELAVEKINDDELKNLLNIRGGENFIRLWKISHYRQFHGAKNLPHSYSHGDYGAFVTSDGAWYVSRESYNDSWISVYNNRRERHDFKLDEPLPDTRTWFVKSMPLLCRWGAPQQVFPCTKNDRSRLKVDLLDNDTLICADHNHIAAAPIEELYRTGIQAFKEIFTLNAPREFDSPDAYVRSFLVHSPTRIICLIKGSKELSVVEKKDSGWQEVAAYLACKDDDSNIGEIAIAAKSSLIALRIIAAYSWNTVKPRVDLYDVKEHVLLHSFSPDVASTVLHCWLALSPSGKFLVTSSDAYCTIYSLADVKSPAAVACVRSWCDSPAWNAYGLFFKSNSDWVRVWCTKKIENEELARELFEIEEEPNDTGKESVI